MWKKGVLAKSVNEKTSVPPAKPMLLAGPKLLLNHSHKSVIKS